MKLLHQKSVQYQECVLTFLDMKINSKSSILLTNIEKSFLFDTQYLFMAIIFRTLSKWCWRQLWRMWQASTAGTWRSSSLLWRCCCNRWLRLTQTFVLCAVCQVEANPETNGLRRLLAVKKSLAEFEQNVELVSKVSTTVSGQHPCHVNNIKYLLFVYLLTLSYLTHSPNIIRKN